MRINLAKLKKGLNFAVVKKNQKSGFGKTSTIAYSQGKREYLAGNLASDTNLLDITSEQSSLVLAVQNNDFKIDKVITLVEEINPQQVVSPLVLKILRDYEIRTGIKIRYTIIDIKGNILSDIEDISNLMSFYNPSIKPLVKTKISNISSNCINIRDTKDIKSVLNKYAVMGIERNFPTYDSATGYGTAVLTDKNNIYFSGQYSSFDKRLNLHSEMTAVLSVLMSGKNEKITHLGLVSSKFKEEPCQICGCCRQFLLELIERCEFNIKFFCFAKDNDIFNEYSIDDLISNRWASGNL